MDILKQNRTSLNRIGHSNSRSIWKGFISFLFLIRVYWNPKFWQGPGLGGLSSHDGPELWLTLSAPVQNYVCPLCGNTIFRSFMHCVHYDSPLQNLCRMEKQRVSSCGKMTRGSWKIAPTNYSAATRLANCPCKNGG